MFGQSSLRLTHCSCAAKWPIDLGCLPDNGSCRDCPIGTTVLAVVSVISHNKVLAGSSNDTLAPNYIVRQSRRKCLPIKSNNISALGFGKPVSIFLDDDSISIHPQNARRRISDKDILK